ncbi:hypothetical protein AWB93_01570 [Mycobacterium bohemicum]|uniref:Uncharacterized protein n=1 Tax=Mycobacterium bohemicum TaxID=56425 RepID=A0A1X1RE15_MYCBE|nr:hypothetical protein AWB93_01570 [Mycobacterium bohemicum]
MGSDADRVIVIYQHHALAWSRDRGERLTEKSWLDRFIALLATTLFPIFTQTDVPHIARVLS